MAGTKLAEAIKSGRFVITAECCPPRGAGFDAFNSCVSALGNVVDAISVPESEDGVRQCSLAGCSHLLNSGAEPVLHLLTRDMNRIALQSAILGAASMGIGNVFCTSGRHQALTDSATAKGVFDIDPLQLLQVADAMRRDGRLADGQTLDAPVELLLGTDANPFAEPIDLHIMVLQRAVAAGADFIMTQPVFDLARFEAWMAEVRKQDAATCIIPSVLLSVPDDIADKYKYYTPGPKADEIISGLRKIEGVGGVNLMTGGDYDAAAKIIASSGL